MEVVSSAMQKSASRDSDHLGPILFFSQLAALLTALAAAAMADGHFNLKLLLSPLVFDVVWMTAIPIGFALTPVAVLALSDLRLKSVIPPLLLVGVGSQLVMFGMDTYLRISFGIIVWVAALYVAQVHGKRMTETDRRWLLPIRSIYLSCFLCSLSAIAGQLIPTIRIVGIGALDSFTVFYLLVQTVGAAILISPAISWVYNVEQPRIAILRVFGISLFFHALVAASFSVYIISPLSITIWLVSSGMARLAARRPSRLNLIERPS